MAKVNLILDRMRLSLSPAHSFFLHRSFIPQKRMPIPESRTPMDEMKAANPIGEPQKHIFALLIRFNFD